jgi:hypothetical protein
MEDYQLGTKELSIQDVQYAYKTQLGTRELSVEVANGRLSVKGYGNYQSKM